MPWVFIFFFQESPSKSLKEELGDLGSNPGSDLGQAPGLGFPTRKSTRLDFLVAKVPPGSTFRELKGPAFRLKGCWF